MSPATAGFLTLRGPAAPKTAWREPNSTCAEERNDEHIERHSAKRAEANGLVGIVDALVAQGIEPDHVLADKCRANDANREYLEPLIMVI